MEAPGGIRILELGDPGLRRKARAVRGPEEPGLAAAAARMHRALAAFRAAHGFGRALAAPQLGIPLRVVALDLGAGPFTLINPELTHRSRETLTLWDDCMSLPGLLVRVRRHASVSLTSLGPTGRPREWTDLEPREAELVQHELDHLDGVLAIDRGLAPEPLVTRAAFARDPERFAALVDLPPRPPDPGGAYMRV